MSSPPPLLLFFLLSSLSISNSQIFHVTKDKPTGQYIAQILLSDSSKPINLVVDLSNPLLWFDCSSRLSSSSHTLISSTSTDCLKAKVNNEITTNGNHNSCDLLVTNGVNGITARGQLALATDVDILFACAPQWLLRGLASGAQGVMGLGKAQISLPSQLSARSNERRRLTVYLSPEKDGVVSTSPVEEIFGVDVSRTLVYTPLMTGSSGGYVISVKSVRVNGEKVNVEGGSLSVELSTVVPYTVMESSIYAVFAEAYRAANKAAIVASVAPFGLCYASNGEEEFPVVEFALQSEMVRWRIQGRNLVVDVGGGVRCLGVVDGGENRVSPIVMGGLQLEGFVLDFDLGNSMMGFVQRTHSVSAL